MDMITHDKALAQAISYLANAAKYPTTPTTDALLAIGWALVAQEIKTGWVPAPKD